MAPDVRREVIMGYLMERINYVKGLMDGMNFDDSTNEGKVIKALADIIEDIALSVEDLEDVTDEVSDALDDTVDRLTDFEDYCLDEEEDEEYGPGCPGFRPACPYYYDYEEEFDDPLTCPECGAELDFEELGVDEDTESFKCPECGTEIDIEWIDCDKDCATCDGCPD